MKGLAMNTKPTTSPEAFTLTTIKAEPRIDSRLLALQLGNQHKATMALIERYADKFKTFGQLPFKKEVGDRAQGGGNPERFALLNEDQAFLLLSLSRNNDRVVKLKVKLVKAFGEARRAAVQHGAEYLPTYHQLHDELHTLAAGSDHERHVHMNVNRLINKTVGLEAGQRSAAPLPVQSMLTVAQAVAAKAAHGAPDHRAGYQRIKSAMVALSAVTLGLEVRP
jgi:phage regulator Rha-like protein